MGIDVPSVQFSAAQLLLRKSFRSAESAEDNPAIELGLPFFRKIGERQSLAIKAIAQLKFWEKDDGS